MLALSEPAVANHTYRPESFSTAPSPNLVEELLSKQPLRRLTSDEHLFFEEDEDRSIFRIESGVVALYRILGNGRRQIMSLRFAGDVVGLDNISNRHCNAVAISSVSGRAVSQQMVDDLIERRPSVASEIIDLIGAELNSTRNQITLLNRRSALEKLSAFILELDRRQPAEKGRAGSVDLTMSRTDIADFLGLTIETVSRNLTKLKTRKIIRLLDIHTLVIVDRAHLRELADGDIDDD
jgi:CRP/FNR family transcriptional regulator